MKRKRAIVILNHNCKRCGLLIDFNTFTALEGFCSDCYQGEQQRENTANRPSF